ncbi:MAG TPA: DUF5916 domain-containing protein, partial [Lacibacter sp.]|nr:DUF5916 domain-containing protein [Lacibacter sp.]
VVYDDAAIYIGAYLYDDPKLVRKQLTPRDGESRQDVDYFSVFFDTYNDDQNGFQFLVTSRNVQSDGRLSPNLNSQFGPPSDYSWDAVWESKTTFQKDGWVVEMRIPYFSLRFAQKDVQDWGLNFLRFTRRNNELTYWNNINPNQNGFVNQFGRLSGLEGLQPPLRLSFLPYVTSGYRTVPSKTGTKNEVLRNGGMDVKWGLNESFTLDATLIPDFGQVISDNVINNLSPFEVQFQENRPFFTEGTEIFNKAGLFYSRRVGATPGGYSAVRRMANDSIDVIKNPGIVQLYNATKFSGRTRKKLGIGVFNAVGAPMYAEIENTNTKLRERILTEPLTNYNLIVFDQALKGRSSVTLTNANVTRNGTARDANVTGLDFAFFDKNNMYALRGKLDYSYVKTAAPYSGFKSVLNIGKVSGKIQYSLLSNIESDRYDPNDLGILQAPNEVMTVASFSYNQLTPTAKFNSYSYSFTMRHEMLYKPFVYTNTRFNARGFWFFKNFWDASVSLSLQPWWQNDYFDLRTPGRFLKKVPFGFISVEGSSDSRKRLFGRWGLGFAESVDIKADAYNFIRGGVRYRFSDRFSLDMNINRTDDRGQFGYAFEREANGDPIIGRRINTDFTTLINGIYNFTPRMNLTLRARHYWSRVQYQSFFNVKEDGFWTDRPFINGKDQNFNVWNLDMFYTWDFNYGSRLIIGWKNWLGNDVQLNGVTYNNYAKNFARVLQEPHGNELTVRLIWFIDYNKLRRKSI